MYNYLFFRDVFRTGAKKWTQKSSWAISSPSSARKNVYCHLFNCLRFFDFSHRDLTTTNAVFKSLFTSVGGEKNDHVGRKLVTPLVKQLFFQKTIILLFIFTEYSIIQ